MCAGERVLVGANLAAARVSALVLAAMHLAATLVVHGAAALRAFLGRFLGDVAAAALVIDAAALGLVLCMMPVSHVFLLTPRPPGAPAASRCRRHSRWWTRDAGGRPARAPTRMCRRRCCRRTRSTERYAPSSKSA